MLLCYLKLLLSSLIIKTIVAQNSCQFPVARQGKNYSLDLSELAKSDIPIVCDLILEFVNTSSNSWFWLEYSPCNDYMPCDSKWIRNGTYMVTQITKSTGECFSYVGVWNQSVMPSYSQNENGVDEYLFEYKNGFGSGTVCSNGRHLNVTYVCDENLVGVPYDVYNVSCIDGPYSYEGWPRGNICRYAMTIPTNLACFKASGKSSNDNGLGAGWIFLIVAIVLLVLYCFVGYIYNANKHGNYADFKKNIPVPCYDRNASVGTVSDNDALIQSA
jgi:hypothetical protein